MISRFVFFFLLFATAALSHSVDDQIAIVGAGFSGLSTAYHLLLKGYKNIKIFENKEEVGGYVTSVEYNDVSHDMATYAMTSAYWRFQNAMEAIGAKFCELNVHVVNTTKTPPMSVNFDSFVYEYLLDQVRGPAQLIRQLQGQASKYQKLYNELMNIEYVDNELRTERLFPKYPEDPIVRMNLSMPMDDYITEQGLELLRPFFVEAADSQAYGPIATTPVLYYMTWFPPTLFLVPESFIPCGPYDSMQDLAELLAKNVTDEGVTIQLNMNVTSVERQESSAILVQADGTRTTYDHVIVTRRLPKTGHRGALVTPILSEEQGVADTLEELQIFSALVEAPRADAVVTRGFLTVDYDAMTNPQADTSFWGILNAEMRNYTGPDYVNPYLSQSTTTRVSATYYYKERADGTRVNKDVPPKIEALQANLAKWDDATWTTVRTKQFGGYFQRWREGGVNVGLPWALNSIQGQGNVYYVNAASCGFESVGHVFDCAKHLVDDKF